MEISDETQTVLDMTIGLTLLVGTLADMLCKADVIDRSDLVSELSRRGRSLEDAQAWPFQTLEMALRGQPVRPAEPVIRLVHSREG